jgi:hypothetical protein
VSGADFAPAAVFGENKELQVAPEFCQALRRGVIFPTGFVFDLKGLGE